MNKDMELIRKTIEWQRETAAAIRKAGGNPNFIMEDMPFHVVHSLIVNNLHIVYREPAVELAAKDE